MSPRHPSHIMKEIRKVSELIIDNKALRIKYPEEVGLELDELGLITRKSELLKELKESQDYFNILMFDITLKDNEHSDLALDKVGRFLIALQDLTTSLVQSGDGPVKKGARPPQDIKDLSTLEIIEATPGSLNIILKGKNKASIIKSRSKEAFDKFNDLIECGDNKELIIKQLKKLGNQPIIRYKELLDLIVKNDINLEFYKKFKPKGYNSYTLDKEFAVSVYTTIIETESQTTSEIIQGKLGVIDTFSKKMIIKKPDETSDEGKKIEGKKVSVDFNEEYIDIIKENLGRDVKIKVDLTKQYYQLEDDTIETRELVKFFKI